MKNKLEDIRKENGITQEQLANALEVSRQTVSSLEKGRYNPSIILAFKIARFFHLKIEDIFIYESSGNKSSKT
ncbi:MAG: helix-turn-helix transcriptional regulator [Tissierellia bacterium]|nr:helix-turn-helix transcriptional regulator [Tissierellia bacterium]